MSKDPYEQLREFLDQFPIGFPKTDSGVEIKILKRLFTKEQTEIAVLLSPIPEEAAQIAVRTGRRSHSTGPGVRPSLYRKDARCRHSKAPRIAGRHAPHTAGPHRFPASSSSPSTPQPTRRSNPHP